MAIKVSIEEIKELQVKCAQYYQKAYERFDDDERDYELEFKDDLEIPEEFQAEGIVLPTARNAVDVNVDHTDVSHANVYVNRKGTKKTSEEAQEMLRKFYLGTLHRSNVESSISQWRVGAKYYWLHGETIFETYWDADRWPDKPVQKADESEEEYAIRIDEWRDETMMSFPIWIGAVHPRNFMADPTTGGKLFTFKVQKRAVFDIKRRWPKWSNPNNAKIDGEVTFTSYWDKTHRCEMADGEPLFRLGDGVVKHKYGFIPFVVIESGLGNIAADRALEKRYVGVLRYVHELLVAESRNFSMADIILKLGAWPWGFLEDTSGGNNAAQVTNIEQKFGRWNPLPPNVKPQKMTPDVPPEALRIHQALVSDLITAHTAANVLKGMGESGVRSGADRRILQAEAGTKFNYATEAFAAGTARVLMNCALLVKNVIPGNFKVWARTPTDEFDVVVDKGKFKEPFDCYVEFAPVSSEDEYRRHDDLERLVQSRIVTPRWARKQMPNVDPIAMERDELREMLKANPMLMQLVAQYMAAKVQERLAAKTAVEQIQVASPAAPQPVVPPQPASPTGRMVPTVPNRAPLGSAENLQNEMEGMRSQTAMNPFQGRGGGTPAQMNRGM